MTVGDVEGVERDAYPACGCAGMGGYRLWSIIPTIHRAGGVPACLAGCTHIVHALCVRLSTISYSYPHIAAGYPHLCTDEMATMSEML
jgi:hypothetical protein